MRNNLKKISFISFLLVLVCCIKEKPVIEKETGDMIYISKEEVYDDFMDKLSNYNIITKNRTDTIADSQSILYDHIKRTGMDLLGYFYIIPIFDEVNKEINSALIYTLKNNYRGEPDINEEIKGHMVVDIEYLSKLNSDDHFTLSWEFKKWENSGLNINEELTKKADELFGKTIITDNRTGETDTLEIQTKSYGNDYVNIEISIRYEITEFEHPQGGIVALSGDTRRRLFEDAMYDTFSSDAINLYFQDDNWGQEATFYMGYPEHMLDNLDQQVISLVRNIETEVETMANSRFEFFLINKHIVIDNINSNTGGSSGGGGLPPGTEEDDNDDNPTSLSKRIFRNSNMTQENWDAIDGMLEKIIANCMGSKLYNSLADILDGKTVGIQFDFSGVKSNWDGNIITLNTYESNILLHEMFHVYQAYQETTSSFNDSKVNLEIEAYVATYRYLWTLPEVVPKSKWHNMYSKGYGFHFYAAKLSELLDSHGNLQSNISIESFEYSYYYSAKYYQHNIIKKDSSINFSRNIPENFKNLSTLSKNCQ